MRRFDNLTVHQAPAPRELTPAQARAMDLLFDADANIENVAQLADVPISQVYKWFAQPDFQVELMTRLRATMANSFSPVFTALLHGCKTQNRHQPTFIKIFFAQFNALFGLRTGPQQNVFFNTNGPPSDSPQLMAPEALSHLSLESRQAYLRALDTITEIAAATGVVDARSELVERGGRPPTRAGGVSIIPNEPGTVDDL